jgi:1,4-dihydroxy-6-naphthoate synthase
MGDRYGPILVARRPLSAGSLKGVPVGIPGRLTSAFLTLQLYDPSFDFKVIPFDQIQQAVMDGVVDAGLLIHEGQLTYRSQGLQKIVDLGEWWFDRTSGLPLPLGGNVIRRDLGADMIRVVSKMLHDSIAYALQSSGSRAVRSNSAGAGQTTTDRFVGMYVNELTLDYGPRSRAHSGPSLVRRSSAA